MLFGLVLCDVPYLFTPDQDVLRDCYYYNATLKYIASVDTIEVSAFPTELASCNRFPRTVEVSLMMQAAQIPIQRKIVRNFDYAAPLRVEFSALPRRLSSLGQAVLFVFSYTEVAEILIYNSYIVQQDLSNCFAAQSQLHLSADRARIVLVPTGHCAAEFDAANSADFEACDLMVEESAYKFQAAALCQQYAAGAEIELFIAGDFSAPLMSAVINAYLVFDLRKGARAVFHHRFRDNVHVTGLPVVFSAENYEIRLFDQNYNYIGLFDDKFILRVATPPERDFALLRPVLAGLHFTHFTFRLTAQALNGDILQLQTTYYYGQFFDKLSFFLFDCRTSERSVSSKCRDFQRRAQSGEIHFALDVFFFEYQSLKGLEKVQLEQVPTCWKRAIVEQNAERVCVVFFSRANGEQCLDDQLFAGQQLHIRIEQMSNDNRAGLLNVSLTDSPARNALRYCLTNDQIGGKPDFAGTALFITFTSTQPRLQRMAYANSVFRTDYKLAKTIPHAAGFLLLGFAIAYTIYGLIDGIKTVVNARKLVKR